MSSFDTNVLSEKVPEFSMAVVEVKRKLEHIVNWATKKSLLFGKGELFFDMSSFDTNVLSEKVPEFSMAVGQEKRVLK